VGWREIASICPLGAVEAFLASRSVFPRALIALAAMIVLGILLGKVFCAWLCPVPPLRGLFTRKLKKPAVEDEADALDFALRATRLRTKTREDTGASPDAILHAGQNPASDTSIGNTDLDVCSDSDNSALSTQHSALPCASCASRRKKLDSRHIVLGGALVSTAVFGFPVFCLICPVGLVFATIIAFWRWVGANDLTVSLIIFPTILLIEMLVLRKWCQKLCPLGAVMSLISLPNRLLRPKVSTEKCLRMQGVDCQICTSVCPEALDPHVTVGMHECSKCGECLEHCPAQAIKIPLLGEK
jgi:ferredoxin-type protein NapH